MEELSSRYRPRLTKNVRAAHKHCDIVIITDIKSFCLDSVKTNSFCIFGKYLTYHRLGTSELD